MRLVAFIVSIVILTMAIMPCADAAMVNSHVDGIEHIGKQSHEHSQEHEDDCTPFCVCECCGSFITIPTPNTFDKAKATFSLLYISHYTFHYTYRYSNGVWHPPALG